MYCSGCGLAGGENCVGRTVNGWHVVGQRPDTREAGGGKVECGRKGGGEGQWQKARSALTLQLQLPTQRVSLIQDADARGTKFI